MLPAEITPAHFVSYPPLARERAVAHLAVLQSLPLALLALLLREVIAYDWKFPAERAELDQQLAYLSGLNLNERAARTTAFRNLRLTAALEQVDWVNSPAQFSEKLSTHLWASGQMDAFRSASVGYVGAVKAFAPPPKLLTYRFGIAVIGEGVDTNAYPLFRRLRKDGTYFSNVDPQNGRRILEQALAQRAAGYAAPWGHWYIDGAEREVTAAGVTSLSYHSLDPVRSALLARMQRAMASGGGPEALRSALAELRPGNIGMSDQGPDAVTNRFKLSVLTEGSGTQVFSTTFVQWSAREALRRAQPLTLFVRFAPRRQDQTLEELVQGKQTNGTDPAGSLIDADMGAYYTWLNQQRLPGSEQSRFLVWFENRGEALAIAPHLPPAASDGNRIDLHSLLARLG